MITTLPAPTGNRYVIYFADTDPGCCVALVEDGSCDFGPRYDEARMAKYIKNVVVAYGSSLILASSLRPTHPLVHAGLGKVYYSQEVTDKRFKSLFDKVFDVKFDCECGAEKCKSTLHSSWCPKN